MSLLSRLLVVVLLLVTPNLALAGMPTVELSDFAAVRLQTISFFGVGILVSALVIKGIWNSLRTEFPFLPHLGYVKSLGLVVLWGLLFVFVLTMISGARELMTPGAWQKQEFTYKLAQESPRPKPPNPESRRRQQLEMLRSSLWKYAEAHDGRLPAHSRSGEISPERWQLPGSTRLRYLYVGGQKLDEGRRPLAYEPDVGSSQRLVLFTDGEIEPLDLHQLLLLLSEEGHR